jgi:hypothetical protein
VAWLGDIRYAGQKDVDDAWSVSGMRGSETVLGWREEVFEPTRVLMERGLWVPVRGNHEACLVEGNDWSETGWRDRGRAWLYFFGDGDLTCGELAGSMHDVLPPFALDATLFGGTSAAPVASDRKVRLVFLDTVRTGDDRDQHKKRTARYYRQHFDTVAERFVEPLADDRPVWLMSHIPIYSMKADLEPTVVLEALGGSKLDRHLSQVRLTAAAHVHRFNLINPGTGNPATGPVQWVVGNGGVALSGSDDELVCERDDVKWEPAGGDEREDKWVGLRTSEFGYMPTRFEVAADRQVRADYRAPMFDQQGKPAPALEVACTGDAGDWSRLSCPSFTAAASGAPRCAR